MFWLNNVFFLLSPSFSIRPIVIARANWRHNLFPMDLSMYQTIILFGAHIHTAQLKMMFVFLSHIYYLNWNRMLMFQQIRRLEPKTCQMPHTHAHNYRHTRTAPSIHLNNFFFDRVSVAFTLRQLRVLCALCL